MSKIVFQENSEILSMSYSNFATLVQKILSSPFEKEIFFHVSIHEYFLNLRIRRKKKQELILMFFYFEFEDLSFPKPSSVKKIAFQSI